MSTRWSGGSPSSSRPHFCWSTSSSSGDAHTSPRWARPRGIWRSSSPARSLSGIGVWVFAGHQYGAEFFAGWLTEYSLSVDNLFIFIIIMSKFSVPRQYQQTALLIGIMMALVMRGIFIAVGAAAINQFSWIFYVFGAVPRLHGIKLAKEGMSDDDEFEENRLIQWVEHALPGNHGVSRRQAHRQGERQAADHADVDRDPRARHHGPAVRTRLDPRHLRAHQRALPRLHGERVRADGSSAAVLPHRRPAAAAGLPAATACRSCWPSSA